MDAVHFTLEASLSHVWRKDHCIFGAGPGATVSTFPLMLRPIHFRMMESFSMTYVDAEQMKTFLEKIRNASGDMC